MRCTLGSDDLSFQFIALSVKSDPAKPDAETDHTPMDLEPYAMADFFPLGEKASVFCLTVW